MAVEIGETDKQIIRVNDVVEIARSGSARVNVKTDQPFLAQVCSCSEDSLLNLRDSWEFIGKYHEA